MNVPSLTLERVGKTLGTGVRRTVAVENLSLSICRGKVVSLFGPNGAGKSTLLAIASGLLAPDVGRVIVAADGGRRPSPLVFQDYRRTLLPWLSLKENIVLPMTLAGQSQSLRDEALVSVLEELGIELPLQNRTYQVSGGQAQLACMCRLLIADAPLLFLDEPFSALDYFKAQKVVRVLRIAFKARDIAVLSVSHDLDEAVLFSDEVVVISGPPARIVGSVEVSIEGRDASLDAPVSLAALEDHRRRVLELANLPPNQPESVISLGVSSLRDRPWAETAGMAARKFSDGE